MTTTAIVLTGHAREWQTVFPNFKEHFIDRYTPDIFLHLWDDEAYWRPDEGKLGIQEGCPLIDQDAVRAAYNPIEMVVENFLDYEPIFAERAKNFPNFYHRPRNIISMFYKMGAGVQLLEQHCMKTGKIYDRVIRMRPDMILHDPLPDFEPNTFYTLAHRNHMGGGTGDMIQVGHQSYVTAFSKIGMNLEQIYAATDLLCPHVASVSMIQALGIPWKEFYVNKTIQHTPQGQYPGL